MPCPYSFIEGQDFDDSGIIWIRNTDCALKCKTAFFTSDEWEYENNEILICSALGFSFTIIFLVTWIFDKSKAKQYLVICQGILVASASAVNVATSATSPFEKRYCRNAAVTIDASDGWNICNTQAFSNAYFGVAIACCWTFQALDLYLKLNQVRTSTRYSRVFLFSICLIPLIPIVGVGQYGIFGYERDTLTCSFSGQQNLDIFAIYIPLTIFSTISLILMILVFFSLMKVIHTSNHNKKSFRDTWRLFRTSILSLIVFLLYFIVLITARAQRYQMKKQANDYMNEWTDCMFDSFYKGTDWKSICGIRPKGRIPLWIYSILHVFAFGIGIFYSLIHLLSKSVFSIWVARWNHICMLSRIPSLIFRKQSPVLSSNQSIVSMLQASLRRVSLRPKHPGILSKTLRVKPLLPPPIIESEREGVVRNPSRC